MPSPQPTLAQAFQAVFGGPLPRPCVHCSRPTLDEANHFTEGDGESGPYAWSEPAHPECVATMAAEAEAYAQGYAQAELERHCWAHHGAKRVDTAEGHAYLHATRSDGHRHPTAEGDLVVAELVVVPQEDGCDRCGLYHGRRTTCADHLAMLDGATTRNPEGRPAGVRH